MKSKPTYCHHFLFHINAVLLFVSSAFSQEVAWEKYYGNDEDGFTSVHLTTDGGYILGGNAYSQVQGYNYWIVKTDSLGNNMWEKDFGGAGTDALVTAFQTSDGGYALGGSSSSNISGDKTENCIGGDDYWIIKTDSIGNILWQNTIGGTLNDYLMSMRETSDYGYILLGFSNSNISGDKTENTRGLEDFWLIKLDSAGNIEWQKTIGGNMTDVAASVISTKDGGYLLAGSSNSGQSGEKTEANIGMLDYWLVKVDATGNIQWQNTIGGAGYDRLESVNQTKDNGFIVSGYSSSGLSGDKSENFVGITANYDYWIIKTDSLGIIQWQNTIGGSNSDMAHAAIQAGDGGYIIAGDSRSSISGDKTEDLKNNTIAQSYLPWILRLDSTGAIVWQNTIQFNIGPIYELALYSYGLVETKNHDFMIGGVYESDLVWTSYFTNGFLMDITEKINSIRGTVYVDADLNGAQGAAEQVLTNHKVSEAVSGNVAFTDSNGMYDIAVLDTGNFSVSTPGENFYALVPLMNTAYFNSTNQVDSLNDFAFQPTSASNDLWVTLSPLQPAFRPGFSNGYIVDFGNAGTTTIVSPHLVLYPENSLIYISADSVPTFLSADSIVWNFPALEPFQRGRIIVKFQVPANAVINSNLVTTSHILPIQGDTLPVSNSDSCISRISGSFDPNDILVNIATLTTVELAAQPFLDYTIRFQNTGNDTAFSVKISNEIDTNSLDLTSIEFVNSSHPVSIRWLHWENNMEFKFDNILLPDSGRDQLGSNGFIKYRIKPKINLVAGDSIRNMAYIYFDYNAPVVTNTAITSIVLPTGSPTKSFDGIEKLMLFPNPVKDELTVKFDPAKSNEPVTVTIYDVYGREVASKQITPADCKLSLAKLPTGIYLLKAKELNAKIIKWE